MNETWIDISVSIIPGKTPLWPSAAPIVFEKRKDMCCGHAVNDTNLSFNLHTATHIDAPSHFLNPGPSVDQLPLDSMIGPCFVADLRGKTQIDAAALEQADIPKDIPRILFKTDNDLKWTEKFDPSFIGLTLDGAQWLVDRGCILVGNDYLSIQPYGGDNDIHRVILRKNIVVLEGLQMSHVRGGAYELVCLPMKLVGVEAAPVRAILRPLSRRKP